MRKVQVASEIFKDRKNRNKLIARAVAIALMVFALLAVISKVYAEDIGAELYQFPVLTSKVYTENIGTVVCEYFVIQKNYTEYSPSFTVPVDMEKGLLYYLENGFSSAQKQIMLENAKKFYQGKENQKYISAGMVCTNPNGSGKVSITVER